MLSLQLSRRTPIDRCRLLSVKHPTLLTVTSQPSCSSAEIENCDRNKVALNTLMLNCNLFANNEKESIICEIGGGWGGFAHCFCTIFPNTKYIITDLPNTLIFSYLFLSEAFPNKKVKLFNYEAESTQDCDFLLIPNTEFDKYKGNIDGAINICSFQEMTSNQVSDYVETLHNMGAKFIYSLNRNLNKNNLALERPISDHISEKYTVEKIDIIKIPYTELNINQTRTSKINLLKNIIKLIIGKKNKKRSLENNYQHLIGKL